MTPGTKCTVNGHGDLFMNVEARRFIGVDCVVVKAAKSGLVVVALSDKPKSVYAFPRRNIETSLEVTFK